jgi:hypothetical protein
MYLGIMKKSIRTAPKPLVFCFLFFVSCFLFPVPSAFAENPASSTYQLRDYGFGAGGVATSSSENYRMTGVAGQLEAGQPFSDTYKLGGGLIYMLMANVPPAPTITNPATNYDRLKVVINIGGNPTDATYAVAISTDNFVTDTRYVKSDFTVGATLEATDFQNYTNWGGATGKFITSLLSNTTYYVKAKARTGNFSESSWGPVASSTTSDPSLTFGLDTSSINFSNLNASNSFTDSSKQTTLTTSTNAYNGYIIYAKETQPLTGPTTIDNYSSPNDTPTVWSGTGFGYSTTDDNLTGDGAADRFTNGGPKYAGFSTENQDPVADHNIPIEEPTLSNETFDILYKVTAPSDIAAGQYENTIIYTVVPTY